MLKFNPKIVFHHIPKCGGTSIVTGLVISYYPARFLKYRRKGFVANLNARVATKTAKDFDIDGYDFRRQILSYFIEKGDVPLISGHYPFDENVYRNHHQDWNFITLLRDPVARWYSEYFWNRYKDHDYKKTDLSMEEYIETDVGFTNARSFVNYFSHSIACTEIPSQKDVNQAIENLQKMRVIGCLEQIDRFKHDMKEAFGHRPFIWNRNKSPAQQQQKALPDVNSDLHKKILDLTAADQEIYHAAKKIIGL